MSSGRWMAGWHRLASLEMGEGGLPIMRDDYEERMGAQGMESSAGTVSAAQSTRRLHMRLTCYLFPVICYLLPVTYYLLPVTCYLLPITYYLLPASCDLLPHAPRPERRETVPSSRPSHPALFCSCLLLRPSSAKAVSINDSFKHIGRCIFLLNEPDFEIRIKHFPEYRRPCTVRYIQYSTVLEDLR